MFDAKPSILFTSSKTDQIPVAGLNEVNRGTDCRPCLSSTVQQHRRFLSIIGSMSEVASP